MLIKTEVKRRALRNVALFHGVLIAASACVLGSAAAATAIDVTNVAMNDPLVVSLSGPGINESVDDSVLVFTTSTGSVLPMFCVDIWHAISLGSANINYAESALLTDSSGALSGTGAALSATQIGEISSLADLGRDIYFQGGANAAVDLAGVQGAIWSIENPAVTVSGETAVNNAIASYVAYASTHQASPDMAFYDVTGQSQGVIAGVPEPASWTLMLMGFGGLGAAFRASRRRQLAA
jgi:PEP-CTERM motif